MPRTRSSTTASPFTSTLIGDIDLLQHVLSFLTKPALARLALANKVLADAVAEHVLSPALWKPEDAALEKAEQMFALMSDDEIAEQVCAKTFRTTKVKLIRLLGELDAPTKLITLLSKTESARSLRLARFHSQVVVFLEESMQHLIKACATSMVPTRLIKFSADTAAVTYDPPRRCLVEGLLTARIDRNWADVWGGAIASSFHREKWTPALLTQLSQTCPHAQTKGGDVLVKLCKAALLDLEHLSTFVHCASTGPTVAASLICDYALRRHFELLDNVSDETSYDEDEIEALNEEIYDDDLDYGPYRILNEAANLIKVMKAVDPPFEVVLQVISLMAERDDERHEIMQNGDYEMGTANGDYDEFLGTETLLNKYFGEGFDIKTLSSTKRQLLLEETMRLAKRDPGSRLISHTLRRIVLQLALGWISQAVAPLKTTNKNAKKIALDVQRICSMLSV